MPRVGKLPEEQKLLAAQIREDFGGRHLLNAKEVGQVIGAKSYHTYSAWLVELKPREIKGIKKYLALDVAGKILYG